MKLEQVFSDILQEPITNLNENTGPNDVRNWTSLAHIHLVTTIEELFQVRLSSNEIKNMKSIGKCREILATKGIEV